MPRPSPSPHPRRMRTRDAMIHAGLGLFAERPIDAVPIDDIVTAAGVAKGSFFNHFADKQEFANAIAAEIRQDIEARVAKANGNIRDPLERLSGGMMIAVGFALLQRDRAKVMLRGMAWTTGRDHPLNSGLREDIDACIAADLFNEEACGSGLQFWLGACQMVMVSVIAQHLSHPEAAERMRETIIMALSGMGVAVERARQVAGNCVERLAVNVAVPQETATRHAA